LATDYFLLAVLFLYALIVVGMAYIFLRVYRQRHGKVKKLK
jgi:hypothetical protein